MMQEEEEPSYWDWLARYLELFRVERQQTENKESDGEEKRKAA